MSRLLEVIFHIVFWPFELYARWRHFLWLRKTPGKPPSPFTTAVLENDIVAVRTLLESGTDANTHLLDTPEKDLTYGGRKEVAPALQVYAPTVLMVAASRGYLEMAQMLLEFGADVNRITGDGMMGQSALHYAAYGGHTEMVAFLLQQGAQVNITNEFETPLMAAASAGHEAIVALLLEHGADVNLPSTDGETPLMAAASSDQTEVVSALIKAGAEINARDQEGHTALWWAEEPQIVAVLKTAGAKE